MSSVVGLCPQGYFSSHSDVDLLFFPETVFPGPRLLDGKLLEPRDIQASLHKLINSYKYAKL